MNPKTRALLVSGALFGLGLPGCVSSPESELDCGPACSANSVSLHRNFYGYSTCWRSWPEEHTACPSDAFIKLEQGLGLPESIPVPSAVPDFVPKPVGIPDSLPTPTIVPDSLPAPTIVPEVKRTSTFVPTSPVPQRSVRESEVQSLPTLPSTSGTAPNKIPSPRSGSILKVVENSTNSNVTSTPRVTPTLQPTHALVNYEEELETKKSTIITTGALIAAGSLPTSLITPESSPTKPAFLPEPEEKLRWPEAKERQPLLAPALIYNPIVEQKPSPRSGSILRIVETAPDFKVSAETTSTTIPLVRYPQD